MQTKPTVKAYLGDAKTLLAFDLPKKATPNLAGFTIQVEPEGQPSYYLLNSLRFEKPGDHAQNAAEPATSSINAPFHKFRWLHIPGSFHQGLDPFYGRYAYRVTPRYFDDHRSLEPMDPSLTTTTKIEVGPFAKRGLELGFTRGYVQSQAFVHHFGKKALIRPPGKALGFATSELAGKSSTGEARTFLDEYRWLGFTARQKIFGILDRVVSNADLSVDVFAYDLNEPDLAALLLELAKRGRARIILDNAGLHHSTSEPTPEDEFEKLFKKAAKGDAAILRGKFGRYSHDKILLVRSKKDGPVTVLTGSTNFSVTGLYVNSNHVLVFSDRKVVVKYADLFDTVWTGNVKKAAFLKSELAQETFSFSSSKTPPTDVTFSPHTPEVAKKVIDGVANRIQEEKNNAGGSVFFAVMEAKSGTGAIYPALRNLHRSEDIFSYGISDNPGGIYLYVPGKKNGVLVTGKPGPTMLPAPFDQVAGVAGHQVHHKFVVCGFNGNDPVVFCGSCNLAQGGEENNGDNLLAIRDQDVATAFVLEALALVDHFEFLDRSARGDGKKPARRKLPADRKQAAVDAQWFLSTDDGWVAPYYDEADLRCADRKLFG